MSWYVKYHGGKSWWNKDSVYKNNDYESIVCSVADKLTVKIWSCSNYPNWRVGVELLSLDQCGNVGCDAAAVLLHSVNRRGVWEDLWWKLCRLAYWVQFNLRYLPVFQHVYFQFHWFYTAIILLLIYLYILYSIN